MTISRTAGFALSALATAWAAAPVPAAAQAEIKIDQILMSDPGKREMTAGGPKFAVDGSGQWLALRARDARRGRDGDRMVELLDFEAAGMLTAVETAPGLSAEDYRFAITAANRARNWGYDGDPLDRGNYKSELRAAPTAQRRSAGERPQAVVPGTRSPSNTNQVVETTFVSDPGIVWIVTRAPRYVMRALKSVYGNEYMLVLAGGVFLLTLGLAALTDILRNARGA